MNLGCIDMGCGPLSEKQSNEVSSGSENNEGEAGETVTATSKAGKNKTVKESGQSTLNILNKFTSQIKKPSHRKSSPLHWFPRKKVDSYLNRKIKLLQELGGMNSTLDETLGDANPHYTRVEKEKIAAREAAQKAVNARKIAMIEASWCRILQAARIQSKEAEAILSKAEKSFAEAFDAAMEMGVTMYDAPNCSWKPSELETPFIHGGGSTTHTVVASFQTAFEVDKEVAAAVKIALIRLANCSSISKDEFKELLRKISQNPDQNEELLDLSSECESDAGSEVEQGSHKDDFEEFSCKLSVAETRSRKCGKKQFSKNFDTRNLVDIMLERLKDLKEEELASLATIVATCGLNAALAEVEDVNHHCQGSAAVLNSGLQRMSSFGEQTTKMSDMELDSQIRRKQADTEIPSLDMFLVKHMSKLEREVLEAKNARMNESWKAQKADKENLDHFDAQVVSRDKNVALSAALPDLGSILVKHSSKLEKGIEEAIENSRKMSRTDRALSETEIVPDLGSMLIKHSSKLEKDIEESKRRWGKSFESNGKKNGNTKQEPEVPSLDKFLVKHVSRLEREVQEAKNRKRKDSTIDSTAAESKNNLANMSSYDRRQVGNENIDSNHNVDKKSRLGQKDSALPLKNSSVSFSSDERVPREAGGGTLFCEAEETGIGKTVKSLDDILVKPLHKLEREKMEAVNDYGLQKHKKELVVNNGAADCESLDKVLVKHISRLERDKMRCTSSKEPVNLKKRDTRMQLEKNEGGLDQILVKHKSRLEQEKIAAAQQQGEQVNHSVARRAARERELNEAWGGLSLGNSIRPHLSKLERDKAAWIKAEGERTRLEV